MKIIIHTNPLCPHESNPIFDCICHYSECLESSLKECICSKITKNINENNQGNMEK